MYRLEALPGAKSYNRQVPAGWQVLSGQGSPELRVLPGPTAGEIFGGSLAAVGLILCAGSLGYLRGRRRT